MLDLDRPECAPPVYIVPNPPHQGVRFVKAFGLSMGFGYPMRAVTIYERTQSSLFEAE